MTIKMSEKDSAQELDKAFTLFSQQKNFIDFTDLKQIAQALGENMSDDELKEMVFEANKQDRDGVVERKDFLSILNKAPNM